MLTVQDIQKLIDAQKGVFATKEDFSTFATKKDILSLKSDLKELKESTTGEFISLKSDLKEFKENTEGELMAIKYDIRGIKEDVGSLRESLQGMIVATDNLTKVISDLRMEYAAISYQLKRHEDWIKQIATKAGVSLVS